MNDETRKTISFRCDAGHEFTAHAWSALTVQFDDQQHQFYYCPICFGQWAVKQWPLKAT
jgi:hypothetical protein